VRHPFFYWFKQPKGLVISTTAIRIVSVYFLSPGEQLKEQTFKINFHAEIINSRKVTPLARES
jgi:hypothetical protein